MVMPGTKLDARQWEARDLKSEVLKAETAGHEGRPAGTKILCRLAEHVHLWMKEMVELYGKVGYGHSKSEDSAEGPAPSTSRLLEGALAVRDPSLAASQRGAQTTKRPRMGISMSI